MRLCPFCRENAVYMFDSDNDRCSKCGKIFLPGEAIDIRTNFNKITESPEALAKFCDDRNICWLEQGQECKRFFKKCKQCWLGWLNDEVK